MFWNSCYYLLWYFKRGHAIFSSGTYLWYQSQGLQLESPLAKSRCNFHSSFLFWAFERNKEIQRRKNSCILQLQQAIRRRFLHLLSQWNRQGRAFGTQRLGRCSTPIPCTSGRQSCGTSTWATLWFLVSWCSMTLPLPSPVTHPPIHLSISPVLTCVCNFRIL